MKNVDLKIEGTTLIIKVDLQKEFGQSKSGKSITVASSEGNKDIGLNGIKLGLNVYKPAVEV